MSHRHIICSVRPGSIAEEMGIEPGDCLLSVDAQEIEDVFDYRYYIEEEQIVLLIEKPDGEQWEPGDRKGSRRGFRHGIWAGSDGRVPFLQEQMYFLLH